MRVGVENRDKSVHGVERERGDGRDIPSGEEGRLEEKEGEERYASVREGECSVIARRERSEAVVRRGEGGFENIEFG